MITNNQHIISRLSWDTTLFDNSIAFDFQHRLSQWSHENLPDEVNDYFDSISSSNRILRIEKLELNLGKINYEELEKELSEKLKETLGKEFSKLLIDIESGTSKESIEDAESDRFKIIEAFFINGYMPWYFNSNGSAISELITELFEFDKGKSILLFKKLAAKINVRKRIVWQLGESHLRQIISGIVPADSAFIFSFSKTVVELQEKENLIKTSTKELSKNVFLWVLNHLLDESGSIFNKVEFVKSSIRQMSNHYNVEYLYLLRIIVSATERLKGKDTSNNQLLIALRIIGQQSRLESDNLANHRYNLNTNSLLLSKDPTESASNFSGLLKYVEQKLDAKYLSAAEFYDLKSSLQRLITTNAENIYPSLLRKLKNESQFSLLKSLLDAGQLDRLYRYIKKSIDPKLSKLISLLETVTTEHNHNVITQFERNEIYDVSFRNQLKIKNQIGKIDHEAIVLDLLMRVSSASSHYFFSLITAQNTSKKLSVNLENELFKLLFNANNVEGVYKFIFKYISLYTQNRNEIITLLRSKINEGILNVKKLTSLDQECQLLKKVLPVRLKKVKTLYADYWTILKSIHPDYSTASFKNFFWRLVWHCTLDSSHSYMNSKREFNKMILLGVSLKYPSINFSELENTKRKSTDRKRAARKKHDLDILLTGMIQKDKSVTINGDQFSIVEYLYYLLENDIEVLLALFHDPKFSKSVLEYISDSLDLDVYLEKVYLKTSGLTKTYLRSLHFLYYLVQNHAVKTLRKVDQLTFWNCAFEMISGKDLKSSLTNMVLEVYKMRGLAPEASIAFARHIRDNNFTIPKQLGRILLLDKDNGNIHKISTYKKSERISRCKEIGHLDDLISSLLLNGHAPGWYYASSKDSNKKIFEQLLIYAPESLWSYIKSPKTEEKASHMIAHALGTEKIITIVQDHQPRRLKLLKELYQINKIITKKDVTSNLALGTVILKCWSKSDWTTLYADKIWSELTVKNDLITDLNITQWGDDVLKNAGALSQPYRSELVKFKEKNQEKSSVRFKFDSDEWKTMDNNGNAKQEEMLKDSIVIENAGIVLLNNYLHLYFERLNLINDNYFVDDQSQLKAVQFLHYLCSGSALSEEYMLSLNKILCGVPIREPIPSHLDISEEDIQLSNDLLNAAISHWSAIGGCSEDGFRGNWIVRNGLLREYTDKWELTVEKKSYDILLNKSPFSFSIIKYDWMKKPIHVSWAY